MATPLDVQRLGFRRSKSQLCVAAVALALSYGGSSALGQASGPYWDWGGSQGTLNSNSSYTPAPFLYDGNVATVQAYLQSQQNSGGITAVRITQPINNTTAAAIFNNPNFSVQYVFADLESASNIADTATLVSQIKGAGGTNQSASAFVGNYSFATIGNDPTLATGRGYTGVTTNQFRQSGVTMNNPQLYPGSPDYRSPAEGDKTISGGNFPNLRSSLFILPIERLSYAAQNNAPGTPLIPYISRFMNNGNAGLINGTTIVNGQSLPSFTPGQASGSLTALQTANQMLSRDDFEAQMLHYRLRGATGFHLLTSGVVGYTDAQFQSDALTGFNFLNSSAYGFAATTTSPLTFSTSGVFGGVKQSSEDAGVIVSGVTNSNNKMAILVSNMTDSSTTYQLPSSIANVSVPASELLSVGADSHNLFEFSVISGQWHLDVSQVVFSDGAAMTDQTGIGVPEPAAISMLAIGAIGLLRRRSRRQK